MDEILLFVRIVAGAFFAISGYHKMFNAGRHATLVRTLRSDHIPFVAFNQWWVPFVELAGGAAVIVGYMTPFAAFGLLVVCVTATCSDGIHRIAEWKPIDKADWVDDLLYLPETLLAVILLIILVAGAGCYSIDHGILRTIIL